MKVIFWVWLLWRYRDAIREGRRRANSPAWQASQKWQRALRNSMAQWQAKVQVIDLTSWKEVVSYATVDDWEDDDDE